MRALNWPALLAEWKRLTDESNGLGDRMSAAAGGDDRYDEDEYTARMGIYLDRLAAMEREIFAADPAEPFAQGTQLQLALMLWAEETPLQPPVQALLEELAAALILMPVPIFPTAEARRAA